MEKVNATLSNKVDGELLSNSISQLKNEIYESFGHYKNDLHQNRKYINIWIFEENISEKFSVVDKNIEKSHEEITKYKDRINEIYDKRKIDQDDTVSLTTKIS